MISLNPGALRGQTGTKASSNPDSNLASYFLAAVIRPALPLTDHSACNAPSAPVARNLSDPLRPLFRVGVNHRPLRIAVEV